MEQLERVKAVNIKDLWNSRMNSCFFFLTNHLGNALKLCVEGRLKETSLALLLIAIKRLALL